MTQKPRYYADLNPRYDARHPSKYERRYVVWLRPDEDGTELPAHRRPLGQPHYQYESRRACERAAERLNEQDRRDLGEV